MRPRTQSSPPSVALIQLTIPGYRQDFVTDLRNALGGDLSIGFGLEHLDPSVRTTLSPSGRDAVLLNRYFCGRRLAYHHGYWRVLRGAEVWVVELNPRIVNSWLALVAARLTGRRAVVWGHSRGRALGAQTPGLGRRLQVALAHGVMAYTDGEATEFVAQYPRVAIGVAPNAVDRAADLRSPTTGGRFRLLAVGRLTPAKSVDLLVRGFAQARADNRLPTDAVLTIVGDGPDRGRLAELVDGLPVSVQVELRSGTFDAAVLNDLYDESVAAACGGYVGLNLTQSLARGVPLIFPRNANHSPEVSLADEGFNAYPFDQATPHAVAKAMEHAWTNCHLGVVDHHKIQTRCIERYSVERMVEGFLACIRE